MKIGITYLFTIGMYGYPPALEQDFASLKLMSELGFHYLEMEGLGDAHTENVWNNRAEFAARLKEYGIHIHNFCAVDPNLVSLDENLRRAAYEKFKRTSELGVYLGTETLHLASYAPPVTYVGKRPYELDGEYELKDRFHLTIPDGFSWERVWNVLVESCRFTAEVAKSLGKTIIMEPRVGEIICSVDSMIRLINDVGMDNFKANFDTGHFNAQRENMPLALMKLENKFANIHISDNDPVNAHHLAVGDGMIDWYEFFRILKIMNYQGYLGLDLNEASTIIDDIKRSIEYILNICKRLDIDIKY